MNPTYKNYTVIYYFNHSKMGFSNEMTVNTISEEKALEKVKEELSGCYGSKMLKRFTVKLK